MDLKLPLLPILLACLPAWRAGLDVSDRRAPAARTLAAAARALFGGAPAEMVVDGGPAEAAGPSISEAGR